MKQGFRRQLRLVFAVLSSITAFTGPGWGGVQPAWIARYNSGLARATDEVVAIALDPQGNIVVAGSTTGAAGDYDYLTLKYSPQGNLLWAMRYASVSNSN